MQNNLDIVFNSQQSIVCLHINTVIWLLRVLTGWQKLGVWNDGGVYTAALVTMTLATNPLCDDKELSVKDVRTTILQQLRQLHFLQNLSSSFGKLFFSAKQRLCNFCHTGQFLLYKAPIAIRRKVARSSSRRFPFLKLLNGLNVPSPDLSYRCSHGSCSQ